MNHNKVIKFRVWDIYNKRFLYPKNNKDQISITLNSNGVINPFGISPECVIFQQFTGLKTKNNIDIYEGDIINCKENRYVVEYSVSRAEYLGVGLFYSKPVYNLSVLDGFVMGNICEHPHLLKNP